MGALNIEVKSQNGVDPIYDDQLFKKTGKFQSTTTMGSGIKVDDGGSVGAIKRDSSMGGNEDIVFVSPISSNRNRRRA